MYCAVFAAGVEGASTLGFCALDEEEEDDEEEAEEEEEELDELSIDGSSKALSVESRLPSDSGRGVSINDCAVESPMEESAESVQAYKKAKGDNRSKDSKNAVAFFIFFIINLTLVFMQNLPSVKSNAIPRK